MEDEDTEAVADRHLAVVTGTAMLAAWYRAAHCLPFLSSDGGEVSAQMPARSKGVAAS